MELTLQATGAATLRAGYSCPCGCTPSVDYARGALIATEGCCCGNQFAIGPRAAATLEPVPGYRTQVSQFDAPWGERLEAAWLVGPSVHAPGAEQDPGHHGDHHLPVLDRQVAADPVCGMTVDHETALAAGLHSAFQGLQYFFCGRGCKLEFDDDPQRYLDPSYVASM